MSRLPDVPANATPQQRAAYDGQGALDELAQWEFWLRHEGESGLAGEVALARMRLYLRARAVLAGVNEPAHELTTEEREWRERETV